MNYWIILIIFTIILSIYGNEESNKKDYIRIIIHLKEKFFQYEINDMIIINATLFNNHINIDIDRYIMKFIWRDNIASLIPTNFGVIEVLPTKYTTINDYLKYFNGLKDYQNPNKLLISKYIDYISLDFKNNFNILTHNKHKEIIEEYDNDDNNDNDDDEYHHFKIQKRKDLIKGFNVIKLPKYSVTLSTTSNDHMHRTILEDNMYDNVTKIIKNIPSISGFISSSIGSDIYKDGFTGKGIKIAVFDTGTNENHPHFNNVKQILDWTNEHSINDSVGHGSFVAGVISGFFQDCPGLAPDAELYIFRVFTSNQLSFTSWFLDAFNYAIFLGIDVINLSIGGPDHNDRPFIEKMNEVTANGIVIVSAIGNDGPKWGTLYSPADQIDVVGVGGYNKDNTLAKFSSRGMTTWELPYGTGRVKPDILASSVNVYSSSNSPPYKCKFLSGTSVASPVVAGAITLLLSTLTPSNKKLHSNIATIKQILISSATRLNESSIFEQGGGLLNLGKAYYNLQKHIPHASLFPSWISNFPSDCPYMWPWCTQSLYETSQPLLANLTLFNSMNVIGKIISFELIEELDGDNYKDNNSFKSIFYPKSKSENSLPYLSISGNVFEIHIQHSDILYPYSGYLAISISVKVSKLDENGKIMPSYVGNTKIRISVNIESPSNKDSSEAQLSTAVIDFNLIVINTPHRSKRILWDTFHNIGYPSPYVPRDDLNDLSQSFDLHGDHPHTNYHNIYNYLLKKGYYVEILRSSFLCFDSNNYGILVIIDPEDEFWPEEINKLEIDIKVNGLSLLIIADWYDEYELWISQFKDESTHSIWHAITGGSNIPTINNLLDRFGGKFSSKVYKGKFTVNGKKLGFNSGNTIIKWPKSNDNILSYIYKSQPNSINLYRSPNTNLRGKELANIHNIIGLLQIKTNSSLNKDNLFSRIIVFGDSFCADIEILQGGCLQLFDSFIDFMKNGPNNNNNTNSWLYNNKLNNDLYIDEYKQLYSDFEIKELEYEIYGRSYEFSRYSKVLNDNKKYKSIDICSNIL